MEDRNSRIETQFGGQFLTAEYTAREAATEV
jgi:hypothetical protein